MVVRLVLLFQQKYTNTQAPEPLGTQHYFGSSSVTGKSYREMFLNIEY